MPLCVWAHARYRVLVYSVQFSVVRHVPHLSTRICIPERVERRTIQSSRCGGFRPLVCSGLIIERACQ